MTKLQIAFRAVSLLVVLSMVMGTCQGTG